jgi:hypothetical protein
VNQYDRNKYPNSQLNTVSQLDTVGATPAIQRENSVGDEMQMIESDLHSLSVELDNLERMLQPLTTEPDGSVGLAEKAPQPASCQLVEQLRQTRYRVQATTRRVSSLNERVML